MGEQTDEIKEETKEAKENVTEQEEEDSGAKEADQLVDKVEEPEQIDMAMMYERSLRQIQEGELTRGQIIKIDDEQVLVDIGYKSEGIIPISEFRNSEGGITANVGDEVDVVLERKEDDEGLVILSMEKAKKIKIWDQVRDVYREDGTISGKVMHRVKGGLSVVIGPPAI